VLVFVNTVVSLFYYLRWIAPVYGRGEPPERTMPGAFVPERWSAVVAVTTAGLSLVLGIGAGVLWATFSA
jgi:NADH-quinone oxidoreductase subunit N